MSNQLRTGESDRRTQLKFRVHENIVDQLDEFVEDSEQYEYRSEALRDAVGRLLGAAETSHAPLQPPTEDQLRTAYLRLVEIANYDGIIPHNVAVEELATTLGKSQRVVEHQVIKKLRQRNYVAQKISFGGNDRAWKLRGINND